MKLRERVLEDLAALGHEAVDLGTDQPEPRIDYPDKALELGRAILAGDADRGILICGSGVGASVAAAKIPGIRAAICHDIYSAHQGVEHDDMNVLCLGSEVVGPELAADLIKAFLGAEFIGGGRYERRLEKVAAIERGEMNFAEGDGVKRRWNERRAARAEPGFARAQPKSAWARGNCEGGGSWGNHGFPHDFGGGRYERRLEKVKEIEEMRNG